MKLEFIGCGAGFSAGLGNNNVMVYPDSSPEEGYVLIDCGESTRLELVNRGLVDKLRAVFITHLHGDHIYGLEMLGFWWYFVKKQRLSLVLPSEQMAIDLWSVLRPTMEDIQDSEGRPLKAAMSDYFFITFLRRGDMYTAHGNNKDDASFKFIKNEHVPLKESYSVVLETVKGKHLFTSDQKNVTVSKEYDTIWHDAQMYDGGKGAVHAYFKDVAEAAERTGHNNVHLMHYNRKPTEDEIGSVKFATPGQVFEL